MKKLKAEFLICGAGIIGLTIARELVEQGYENIIIIEKEAKVGLHASGRNSGVLHSGIYYNPDSLKAKSCLSGNFLIKEYCREKNIPVFESGKVIVAKDDTQIETLKLLYEQAIKNGAKVELIGEKKLEEIEPGAKTFTMALYSHYTAVVDPKEVLNCLCNDFDTSERVIVLTQTEFKDLENDSVATTNNGLIEFDTFINAAGMNTDMISHKFGVGLNYRMVPFKGFYKKLRKEKSGMVRGNIYPVPNIKNPFLGVHFTRDIRGNIYVGPTATPALGRENYGLFTGIDFEAVDIMWRDILLFVNNPKFREVAFSELRKYFSKSFFKGAKDLVKCLNPEDLIPSSKVGIRPQLVNWSTKELVMDFKVIKKDRSIHILNAVSPAFTSSMDFARYVVQNFIS